MKSFFVTLLLAALIVLAGGFFELWTVPYVTKFPSYRNISLLGEDQRPSLESRAQENLNGTYKPPFRKTPNADADRRGNAMRDAGNQMSPK